MCRARVGVASDEPGGRVVEGQAGVRGSGRATPAAWGSVVQGPLELVRGTFADVQCLPCRWSWGKACLTARGQAHQAGAGPRGCWLRPTFRASPSAPLVVLAKIAYSTSNGGS